MSRSPRPSTPNKFVLPRAGVRTASARVRPLLAGAGVLTLAVLAGLSQSGTPAEARFPGLNGKIVCEGARGPTLPPGPGVSRLEIYTINPDGTGETQLTNNEVSDGDPVFSPDGKRIAFQSARSGGQQIYVGNADGNLNGPDVKRLTASPGGNRQPSWSPDGTQLAFHSGRPAEFPAPTGTVPDFEIYKMSATTGEENGPAQRLTTSRGQDAIPAWSPDGSKIAFQSLRESVPTLRNQDLEIFTMNPDGSGVTNVTNSHGSQNDPNTAANENSNALDSTPTWSPDSRFLTFGSTRDSSVPGNQNFEVYKINRDGANPTRLTLNLSGDTPNPQPFRDYDHIPSWSPDGTRIIFHSGRTSTAAGDEVVAYTMDSTRGEAAGLQRLAPTGLFAKCDWESIPAVVPPVYDVPGPGVTPPGSRARILPNLFRPGGSARQVGRRIVVRVRGRLGGVQGRSCVGRVKIGVRFARNRRVVSGARVGENCRYSKRVSFPVRRLPRASRSRRKPLIVRVAVRFQGNAGLRPDVSPTRRIKVRR